VWSELDHWIRRNGPKVALILVAIAAIIRVLYWALHL
jgi:hypothetical protein